MLAAVIRTALRYPLIVICLSMALLGYGAYALVTGKYDVFPEFVPAQASIQTEAPGLLAEDVERLVTRPLENAINGGGNIATVRSESSQGLSLVDVTFSEGSDIFRDRQLLAERIAEVAPALPAGVGQPVLGPMTSSTMDLIKLGFTSDTLDPLALRDLVEWTIKPRLLAVPGVARAIIYGGGRSEIQVVLHADRLAAYGLGIDDVTTALRQAISLRATGFADTPNQRVLIQVESGNTTPAELAGTVLTQATGANLTLGQVADVAYAPEPMFGDAHVQGRPDVLVSIGSQYESNTLEVTLRVEAALAELRPMLEARDVQVYDRLHRPATFIETALRGIRDSLVYGTILVALTLVLFLRSWRSTLISFLTIPLSLLFAVLVMQAIGWSINTMTLSGLAVAIGVVVDDAIIDVENIMRRLRLARASGAPFSLSNVIFNASMEVRRPILLATVIVGMVFVPALLLPGLQGKFFAPLASAFLLATFGSLLVALTVSPAFCLLLLKYETRVQEPPWLHALKVLQQRCLRRLRKGGTVLLGISMLAGLLALVWTGTFGRELMPMFREGHLVVQFFGPGGTGLGEMTRVGDAISRQFLDIGGIATVSQQVGRAEAGEDTWAPNRSEFHVELETGLNAAREEEIQASVREVLSHFPGFNYEVLTFLGDRISESISGETAAVTINVIGNNLDEIDQSAASVAAIMNGLPQAADVQLDTGALLPTLQIRLLPQRLASYGLRNSDVLDVVEAAYAGTFTGTVYSGDQAFNVRLTLAPDRQLEPEEAGDLQLTTPSGRRIRLAEVASIDLVDSRSVIRHQGGLRRQVVNLNPEGNDVVGFVARARSVLNEQLNLPKGVYLEFSGAAEEALNASRELFFSTLLAAVISLVLLYATFRSFRAVALVLVNVPFTMLGGVAAVAFTGASMSLGTLVGLVTLFGISARNTIMLISHYDHLLNEEGRHWNLALALRGARERFIPILMTALVTGLGLMPLALGSGEAGREIEGPMAQVILGGLLSSTLLNLFVLPVIAARFLKPASIRMPPMTVTTNP